MQRITLQGRPKRIALIAVINVGLALAGWNIYPFLAPVRSKESGKIAMNSISAEMPASSKSEPAEKPAADPSGPSEDSAAPAGDAVSPASAAATPDTGNANASDGADPPVRSRARDPFHPIAGTAVAEGADMAPRARAWRPAAAPIHRLPRAVALIASAGDRRSAETRSRSRRDTHEVSRNEDRASGRVPNPKSGSGASASPAANEALAPGSTTSSTATLVGIVSDGDTGVAAFRIDGETVFAHVTEAIADWRVIRIDESSVWLSRAGISQRVRVGDALAHAASDAASSVPGP